MDKKYVPAVGNTSAKLMILGEAPSYKEVELGRPFVGPSGAELDSLLRASGINRASLWISNVCKYFVSPPTDKKIPFQVRAEREGIDLDKELHDLQEEINSIRPNCILALGGTALWALTGKKSITNYRGSILHGMGRKVVPTFHPAHLLHQTSQAEMKGYWNRAVMILDFKRALEESLSPDLILPSRTLSICRSSAQLADFIARHQLFTKPAIDIEAGGTCIPVCIGIAYTPHEGLTVPLWNTDELFRGIPDCEMVQMWILVNEILSNNDIIGQNFKYDQDKIARLGFTIRSLASDTMLKSFTINPELPKRLAFNQSIYTKEPFYKDEGMYQGNFGDLLIGCARDACVTKEIDLAQDKDINEMGLRDWYENFVMQLHELYLGIENEGFYIDSNKRDELIAKYIKWSEQLAHELFTLTGAYINVNSPKQVYILLFEVLHLPRRAGTGEEELTALLNNQSSKLSPTNRRIVEIILEKRRVDKTVGNYLMAMPDYDGKMKTTYYLCLETGRTSTGQLEPPIRPYIEYKDSENKKKKKAIGTAFQTITKHGDIGNDVRAQYVPEPGHVFINADLAQAEARVVFLLANDEQALKDIDEHDYHALTASWFFGGTESDYSKKVLGYESPIRFAGKAQPLWTSVLTPNGWKIMGELKIGDDICNTYGGVSQVTGIFIQGLKDVYEITFSDKSKAWSCKEHLWPILGQAQSKNNIYIKELQQIQNEGLVNGRGNPTKLLPSIAPVHFNEIRELPIDPYVMGLLIGDGTFSHPYMIYFSTDDQELIQWLRIFLSLEHEINHASDYDYRITGLRSKITELGIGIIKSEQKFIPELYKYASKFDRLELLRGLLDTDGSISNGIEYSTVSEILKTDIIELVNSLGGIATWSERFANYTYKGEKKQGQKSYRISISMQEFNPFKLKRKADLWKPKKHIFRKAITKVEKISNEECQCIEVNSNNHLYITDNYIPTHNTLRHAGHLGAGKRRASVELNTQARKYKIPISITESIADRALKIFHAKQPKIQQVFHAGIIKALEDGRRFLTATVPFGINSSYGGKRQFFERWGDELFRQAFSYIPQRAVSDNTKAAALRLRKREPGLRIILEAHDALLFMIPEREVDYYGPIIREEMERPIRFDTCSLPRHDLVIPCDVEIGYNYQEFKKFKFVVPIRQSEIKEPVEIVARPLTVTEEFRC